MTRAGLEAAKLNKMAAILAAVLVDTGSAANFISLAWYGGSQVTCTRLDY